MKKVLILIVGMALTASHSLQAQLNKRTSQVVERGPHHQTVEFVESYTNRLSGVVSKTNRVTTLKTGMHRQVNGQWVESKPEINPVVGGAMAAGGAHEVFFKTDAASPAAVQITLPGGARLSGHVLGLYYYDAASGQSVRLATIKSSSGEILPDNEVVYRDCFDGLTADLKYRYEAGRLEQDVVIRDNPAPPSAFGLSDQTTRMEVIAEFLEGQPAGRRERVVKRLAEGAARQTLAEPDWTDEWLDFGPMQMGKGRAFRIGQQDDGAARSKQHPVGKRWEQVGGRKLLIESVEYEAIEKDLSAMKTAPTLPGDQRLHASRGRVLANPMLESAAGGEMLASSRPYEGDGLVIDYDLTASFTSLSLGNLVTYVVEGWVSVSQSLTIYDGAIVKYAPGAKITVSGYLTTPSSGLAIFTARDDDSVGAVLPTSTGQISGMYGYPALELYNVYGTTIRNLQFRHCQIGLSDYSGYYNYHYVQNCQFLDCYRGINSNYTPVYCSYLTMCNVYEPYVDQGVLNGSYPAPMLQHSSTTTMSGCSGGVGAPTCNPPGNVYNGAQMVTVTCPTPNVTIRYRLVPAFDTIYTDVTENDPVLPASGQVQVDGAKALLVRAWRNGIPKFCSTSQLHSYLTKIVFPSGVQGGSLAGSNFIPFNMGDYLLDFTNLDVLVDGVPFPHHQVAHPYGPLVQAGTYINFNRLNRGAHSIQVKVAFQKNEVIGEDSEFVELATTVATFTSTDKVTFADWKDLISGTSHTIAAKLAHPVADWTLSRLLKKSFPSEKPCKNPNDFEGRIFKTCLFQQPVRIYSGAGLLLRTASGQTVTGEVTYNWDVRDSTGQLRTDLAANPSFYVTVDVDQGTRQAMGAGISWPAQSPPFFPGFSQIGNWLFAFQDFTKGQWVVNPLVGSYNEEIAQAMAGAVLNFYQLTPPHSSLPPPINPLVRLRFANHWEVADRNNDDAQINRNNDWQVLSSLLANGNTRNFYYIGHGNSNKIGADYEIRRQNGDHEVYVNNSGNVVSSATLTRGALIRLLRACLKSKWW